MTKQRLFKIMANAKSKIIAKMADKIKENYNITIIKEPTKTLTMIKMREPVKQSLFYIGEVIVTECIIELYGTKGFAVCMGDDFDKTLNMAIIDAAYNKGVFTDENLLLELECEQLLRLQKENAMHLKTMVSFKSMDSEVV
ncbi:phosphonate C-P lyase system protein PhnG [Acetivibrio cellulolyticus]|uniref:phosphonate C-P lyase system protein PhnG n=1 Tax=Acetivibrio cellulolyticus TaxID=35830 RepID=UPI0001E2CBC2|nr:phosphonate C-P lyase system protein PhnG [Acetivibrio cellulolyticus]